LVKQLKIKKLPLFLGLTALLFLLLSVFSSQLLSAYARCFIVDTATKGADAILILSGNARTRPDKAAQLLLDGYAPKLYYTDQKAWQSKNSAIIGHPFRDAAKILATYNLQADIIPSRKRGATSTFDEAHDFVVFLKENPIQHVILVTDSYHTARAYYAFKKIMDLHGYTDLQLEMAAAPNELFNETS
jgi:uncharacterized SAM-binding protein YcdF (DUF218 family)